MIYTRVHAILKLLLVGLLSMVFVIPSVQAAISGASTVTSSTHQQNVSSTNSTVNLSWSGAIAGNGGILYDYVLDQTATTNAATFLSQFAATASATLKHASLATATSVTLSNLADGTWYFHLRTSDADGVPTAQLVTFGPVILDSAPTISSTSPISPSTGSHAKGISVTVNGTKFMAGATVDLIKGVSTIALTNVVIVSDKQITASLPKGTAPGTYDLRVTNAAPFKKNVIVTAAYQSTNQTPVANPGTTTNLTLNAGSQVTLKLDGSASSDNDNDPLSYAWTTVTDPSGLLAKQFSAVTKTFNVGTAGTYTFSLKVNDGFIDSGAKQVSFVVKAANTNNPPVANAGADQLVASGTQVALSGSQSKDRDGNPLTYKWAIATKPAASALTSTSILQANGISKPTASFTPDVSGAYAINLIVNDGTVDSPANQVVITVNDKPTANAGSAQSNLPRNKLVTLDASGSTDPENDALSYAWTINSKPATATLTLSSSTVQKPTFTPIIAGTYIFDLVVTDAVGNVSTNAAQVTITILAASFDVDGSGLSDANDGVMILRKLSGAVTVTTGIVLPAGQTNTTVVNAITSAGNAFDVDGNGIADANDAVMVLRRLNGATTVSTGIALPTAVNGLGTGGARTDVELVGAIDALK